MKKSLGQKITEIRVRKGLSQHELADKLNKNGVSVSNQKISKWETDYTVPNAKQFIALCEVLSIYDVLSVFSNINSPLAHLNQEGQNKVDEYIHILLTSGLFSKNPDKVISFTRTLKLFDLPVSAGTGEFLECDYFEKIEVGNDVPEEADFALRISGNSMEPVYQDGQIVWVHQQEALNDGDIGIFSFENKAYCKKLSLTTAATKLVSLNPDYKPILIPKDAELRVFGKVIK